MAVSEPDEPSELRRIARALPRKRVAIVIAMLAVNVIALSGLRGTAVARNRIGLFHSFCTSPLPCGVCGYVPPWEWTADEWGWPWK
ncbi:MAG: hypothetical protein ACAI25_05320 [Planctomycetota bacterium]